MQTSDMPLKVRQQIHGLSSPNMTQLSADPGDRGQALGPAAACCDDEGLTKWMRMPCGSRARLESYIRALNECRLGLLKQRIDPHSPSEPV